MPANTMHAVVATGYGGPEVYQYREVSKPQPKENEVLIRVHASSVTAADTMIRTGTPYFGRLFIGLRTPKHPIPGTGFAGVVETTGKSVNQFKPGDRVFGETTLGFSTNAEFVTVPGTGVILPMPEGMSFEEGATFTDGPLTSYNFLKEIGQIQPGQKVLINGASGSLGTAAVQLAKYLEAEVTGVCSTRNMGLVESLGADHVIDYTQQDFTNSDNTYDLIFDTVGKSSFSKSKKALTPRGKYLSPVLTLPLLFQMMWTGMFSQKKALFAATGLQKEHQLKEMLQALTDIFQEGQLNIVIDRQYPLEKVAEAHRYVDTGRKKGNVVILVNH